MSRARYFEVAQDQSGRPVPGVTVAVYDEGTTDPIAATIYSAATGGGTLTNPLTTSSQGEIEFWLPAPQKVDLVWSKSGLQAETHTVDVLDANELPDFSSAPQGARLTVTFDGATNATAGIESHDGDGFAASPTGGSYTISFRGQTTAAIAYDADPLSALEALSSIGTGNIATSGSMDNGAVGLSFIGALGAQPITDPVTANGTGLTGTAAPYSLVGGVPSGGNPDGPRTLVWQD